jgi:DNA-binding NtrC family response regulator
MDPLVNEERTAISRRKVILIIEDDFLTRWSAAEYLRETKFDVIEAVSAAEGIAAMQADTIIDAIFCDASLISGLGGEEFLQCLTERHPNLPVLLASDHMRNTLFTATPSHLIVTKPYEMGDVERQLRAMLAAS